VLAAPLLPACSGTGRTDAADALDDDARGDGNPDGSFEGSDADVAGRCDPLPVDAPHTCSAAPYTVTIDGATSSCEQTGGGYLSLAECRHVCGVAPTAYVNCSIRSATTVDCQWPCIVDGRRPSGLEPPPLAPSGALGEHFARVAYMEAASIEAFEHLVIDLRENDAPEDLVAWAARAAHEEARHARVTGALARRFGAEPHAPREAHRRARTLEDIAVENEIEGCMRETYAALQARHQAHRATDRRIRDAMARIAREEEGHASLAWSVSAWFRRRLPSDAVARLDEARASAIDRLANELSRAPDAIVVDRAGVPSAHAARALLDAARALVWS
jgi:hypothetical protein